MFERCKGVEMSVDHLRKCYKVQNVQQQVCFEQKIASIQRERPSQSLVVLIASQKLRTNSPLGASLPPGQPAMLIGKLRTGKFSVLRRGAACRVARSSWLLSSGG